MRQLVSPRFLVPVALALCAFTALSVLVGSLPSHPGHSTVIAADSACPSDDTGLKLPHGFCATIFADGIGCDLVFSQSAHDPAER